MEFIMKNQTLNYTLQQKELLCPGLDMAAELIPITLKFRLPVEHFPGDP